jgi:hypothetical protein
MSNDTGKYLIIIGGIVVIAGLVIYFFGNNLKWIGHLPGDIRIERANFKFYFPLTTLILLNLIIFLITRIWRWLS